MSSTYGPGTDEPIVMVDYTDDRTTVQGRDTAIYTWYHQDRRGSVIALSDEDGEVVSANIFTYDSYGVPNTWDGNRIRFTGRWMDADTGLYYYRARFYSPSLGRFLQADPIGYGDGMNMYAYVGGDPMNAIDPAGTDIIILNDPDILGGWSDHQGMLIGNDTDGWDYYSLDGASNEGGWGEGVYVTEHFETLAEAAEDALLARYDTFRRRATTTAGDERMRAAAGLHKRDHPRYNLNLNNCGDYVRSAASVVDRNFPNNWSPRTTIGHMSDPGSGWDLLETLEIPEEPEEDEEPYDPSENYTQFNPPEWFTGSLPD